MQKETIDLFQWYVACVRQTGQERLLCATICTQAPPELKPYLKVDSLHREAVVNAGKSPRVVSEPVLPGYILVGLRKQAGLLEYLEAFLSGVPLYHTGYKLRPISAAEARFFQSLTQDLSVQVNVKTTDIYAWTVGQSIEVDVPEYGRCRGVVKRIQQDGQLTVWLHGSLVTTLGNAAVRLVVQAKAPVARRVPRGKGEVDCAAEAWADLMQPEFFNPDTIPYASKAK
ncbi:hypothetical protein GTO91_16795 [Heliobacterium undosum]|uniref:Uncharacterized protein n=1 Tax=Heliomicrobium undosum TaxID=121734 RepID=A0A845L9Q4_9FIRM|nr:hypothetical protein [Heliomicrobium undosum]MZP31360.1 hypothetical protein [Heliomicrobium undosum]